MCLRFFCCSTGMVATPFRLRLTAYWIRYHALDIEIQEPFLPYVAHSNIRACESSIVSQSYIFILRKHDKQLRGVSAVTSRSKVRLLGNHDLHITSLEPSQEYHLRFSDSRTSDGNENSERDDWYDNLRGARQKRHGSLITVALGNVGPQQ